MIDYYKICYTAQYPDGKLLDPSKPFMDAYVIASSKDEAITSLKDEFPGLDIKISKEPVHMQMENY